MTQQTKGESATVLGVITGIIQPRDGAIPTTPGKILIKSETSGDDCTVSVWQLFKDNERTTEMPDLWNTKIHPEWSIGKRVMIGCQYKDAFVKDSGEVIHQYTKMVSIEYLGGGTPPEKVAPSPTPTVAPTTAPSATPIALQSVMPMTFEEKKRHDIAWHGAVNLAVPVARKPVDAIADDLEHRRTSISNWIERIDELAWPLYLLKLRGPVPVEPVVKPVQLTPEEELFPEANDLGAGLSGEII